MTPLNTAVYWIEYVAKHKGAPYMKTAAVGMPTYQYFLIDVVAFIIVVLILTSIFLYWAFKKILSLLLNKITKKKLD